MKTHTNNFKNAIKVLGRELDSKITYTENNTQIELGGEQLNSISLHYEGAILKSVMKQLDIDSNVDIPLNTVLNAQFGVKVNGTYEYLNFGNFVVYKSEKQEDLNSYKITCYDKMLYSMVDYKSMSITYPITIRNYLSAICTELGLTFANSSDTFTNYNKTIPYELYLDSEGNSLEYSFRDVLDELAEVTASTICINNNDELEIRYTNNTNDTIDEEFLKDVNVNIGKFYGPINTVVLSRAEADEISQSIPSDLADDQKKAIKITDNQIMNFDNRDEFLANILTRLNGLQYYVNDFASTGICYYELCDKYNVSIGNENYSCIMLNDEINITQGLEENIYAEMPEEAQTEYKYTSKTDKTINRTTINVNKQEGYIEEFASRLSSDEELLNYTKRTQDALGERFEVATKNIDENGNITEITTTNGYTFNSDGLNIYTSENSFNTQITNTAVKFKDGDKVISETNKDGVISKDFKQQGLHQYSWDGNSYDFSDERVEIDNEYGYATFYNGND